ncbi:zeta toxin family protein [Corynebacterium lizhenjunii]|uniref:zeta toxin family protein n=1 Tax=Corynebacterium lizhenjunii TaxID=2709394 RepID=UPI0013EC5A51|nr:zeta toxin family protein [Corynebacterium lizhenjunii]
MYTAADFPVSDAYRERMLRLGCETMFEEPSNSPTVVYVAGQPASGKTVATGSLPSEFVVLDSDELRQQHPAMDEIMRVDPLRMDVLSNGPVPYWMSGLIDYGRSNGYSMVIENTLSNPDFIASEIAKFHAAGFSVRLVALAVAQEESRLGIVTRYLDAKEVSPYPRWTSEVAHTNAYKAIVPGLRALAPLVDELEIRTRDGRRLDSIDAIETERAEWFAHAAIREDWLARFGACDLTGLEGEKLTQNLIEDAQRLRSWNR